MSTPDPTTIKTKRRPYYWENHPKPEGRDLADLRRGIGREPGTVPEMWPYYTSLRPNGELSERLRAEHAALCLFASHQQSQSTSMHRAGIGLGNAMAVLRRSDKFSGEAVDRRFTAAATATSFTEIVAHLRGLVTQLRSLPKAQPLDYTRLVYDLLDWQDPEKTATVRRRWGSQYFTDHRDASDTDTNEPSDAEVQ
jgi:CRISPR system Cascade subunit CasB